MKTIPLALISLVLLGAPAVRASILTYQFTINTQTVSGQADNLDFQLNPGVVPGAPGVSIVISNFAINGGAFNAGNIQFTGDASGLLSGSLTLDNGTGYNDAYQPVTLGSSITFRATLSGTGVANPASPGTFFGFSIYDNAGVNPLLTTSGDGTIAGFNIDATNGVAPFTNPATVNGASAATVAAASTPEPSTAIGLMLGLGVMLACFRKRVRTFSI